MEKQQGGFDFQEEVIQIECSQEMIGEEQSEEGVVDDLMPQPAFQIEEDHQNLTQEEREAFSYIFSVRSQKEALLKDRSKHKNNIQISQATIEPIFSNNLNQECEQIWTMLSAWKEQSISNWRLVVQNLKYLQKTASKEQYFKRKLTLQDIQDVPQAYSLCLNTSLNLSYIERYLIDISNLYYEKLQDKLQGIKVEQVNYHMWIYSLLALHQSYACYTNFQALASINAAIEKQSQYLTLNKYKSQITNEQVISWIVNLLLLIDVFKQTFLKKHLHIVRLYGLI